VLRKDFITNGAALTRGIGSVLQAIGYILAFGIIGVILCIGLFYLGLIYSELTCDVEAETQPQVVVTRLAVGSNRTVVILGDACYLNARELSYQVKEGWTVTTPTSYLGSYYYWGLGDEKKNDYDVIYAEEQSLIGVIDKSISPPDLLIIHDFKTGYSWPHTGKHTTEEQEKWNDFYERLRQENPVIDELYLPLN